MRLREKFCFSHKKNHERWCNLREVVFVLVHPVFVKRNEKFETAIVVLNFSLFLESSSVKIIAIKLLFEKLK